MSELNLSHEREARIMEFRREANARLVNLLKPCLPMMEIAQLLGAEDLITVEKAGRGQKPVYHLNVQAFIQREIDRGTFLRLPDSFEKIDDTVLPPDKGETIRGGSGEGVEEKKIVPRSQYLVEVLTELNQPYQVISGTNTANMVRGESYQMFVVPGLEKVVLVNNEEGNATFIVSVSEPGEYSAIMGLTKDGLKNLGEEKVAVVIHLGNVIEWKQKIKLFLTKEFRSDGKIDDAEPEPEVALAGWTTNKALSRDLGVNPHTTKLILDRYITAHPDLEAKLIRLRGTSKYLHPELVAYIRTDVENRAKPPEGWQVVSSLEDKTTGKTIQRLVNKNIQLHGKKVDEWVGDYVGATGKPSRHLHPELIRLITAELDERESAPAGWLTNHALSEVLKREQAAGKKTIHRRATIREIIKKYRGNHSEWFKTFKTTYNPFFLKEHFHPDLVEIIKRELMR